MKRNRRFRLPWSLLLLLLLPAVAPGQPVREWVKRYNATGNYSYDVANAVKVDASGNVLAAGGIGLSGSGSDFVLLKRNHDGELLWRKTYNGAANEADRATALATDRQGNAYVAGWTWTGETGFDYATLKYDRHGRQKWVRHYTGPGNGFDVPAAITTDAAGNVYVTGYSQEAESYDDYTTIKYSPEGEQLWVALYNGPGNENDIPTALGVDTAGNVYVTGFSFGTASASDYATVKYNRDGVQQWVARFNGSANSYDAATAMALDAAGNVYVTGRSYGTGTGGDYATIKYNSGGVQQWLALYNGGGEGYDQAAALAVDGQGQVYVTGSSQDSNAVSDYATIKYSAAGVPLWTARYSSQSLGFLYNTPTALAVNGAGQVYVTGLSGKDEDLYNGDFATVKYDTAGRELWAQRFNGTGNLLDGANAMALDARGNAYVAGGSWGQVSGMDYLLLKYAPNGDQKWVKRETGSSHGTEQAAALAVPPSGNGVAVTGSSSITANADDEPLFDYLTLLYDDEGKKRWTRRYNGPGEGDDQAFAVALDARGHVLVTGRSTGKGTGHDFATIQYDQAGKKKWEARYNGPGNGYDGAYALATDRDGNVYVTGNSDAGDFNYDFTTIKYNKKGVQQWVAHYNGPGNDYDYPTALAVDSAGNVYVTGYSMGDSTGLDYATLKYDRDGTLVWAQRYAHQGEAYDVPVALKVDAAGNVIVAGYSQGAGTYDDYATVKYSAAGARLWVARYNGPGGYFDDAAALAVDGSGNVYVTGFSYGNGTYADYATVKYNGAGVQQWVARYNGPAGSNDAATALALEAGGNLFVTGRSFNGASYDFATVYYDSLGRERWTDLFNGTGNSWDEPSAIALRKGGGLYLTGTSVGVGTSYDFLTLQYGPGLRPVTRPDLTEALLEKPSDTRKRFRLSHYPNPVSATAILQYELPAGGQLSLKLYDLQGREVAVIARETVAAGAYTRTFNASGLSAGVYYYRLVLQTPEKVWERTSKMIVR
ncbi:SBBP repeat-containing protein [Paraflavisolibacter sp. H34]|uniref:SBBP repeat-containing protein n=1 Tax=Huijunlia imazamoxiresistens TaxID=3127457 RepID=UPI00301828A7